MHDADVRERLLAWTRAHHAGDPSTKIVEELGLLNGQVVLDVAVINGELTGFEIKSDLDTLVRLPAQAAAYGQVLDRVTLVVGSKHLAAARRLIPRWWGLVRATVGEAGIVLTPLRNPVRNPKPNPIAIASLLWRDEVLSILERLGSARGLRSHPRPVLYERLAGVMSLPDLQREVREALKGRQVWRAA